MLLVLLALVSSPPEPLQLALAEKKPAPAKPAPKPKPPPADDFDLLPKEAAPDAAAQAKLEEELEKRRTMLHYHQMAGFAVLGTMTATVVLGQLDYSDKYGGGGDKGTYHLWHRWFGFGTAAVFAGTASLAVFAPVPIEKKVRWDTATIHKVSMAVAAAGMAAQIVLGIVTAAKEGQGSQRDYALAHQIIGYGTAAAVYTGFAALTF